MRITAFCAILIITNENLPYQPAERCTYHKAKVSYHDLKYPVCRALIDPVRYAVRAAYPTFFVTFRGSANAQFRRKGIREWPTLAVSDRCNGFTRVQGVINADSRRLAVICPLLFLT